MDRTSIINKIGNKYHKLTQDDFQKTINNYLSYLVKEGTIYEE